MSLGIYLEVSSKPPHLQLTNYFTQSQHGHRKQPALAGELLMEGLALTKQQQRHFGCQDPTRLNDLQMEAVMVSQKIAAEAGALLGTN